MVFIGLGMFASPFIAVILGGINNFVRHTIIVFGVVLLGLTLLLGGTILSVLIHGTRNGDYTFQYAAALAVITLLRAWAGWPLIRRYWNGQ